MFTLYTIHVYTILYICIGLFMIIGAKYVSIWMGDRNPLVTIGEGIERQVDDLVGGVIGVEQGLLHTPTTSSNTYTSSNTNTHTSYNINITYLAPYFFILYFLMATQDIAVDGWALTMLSRYV